MNEILTPCILQSIIICSTIIILCVVAVSAFRIHKVESRKKELKMEDTENSPCLGSYIFLSSIVVLIAVVIFSYAFFSDKKVLDFMSLASALVSIILAVITIIYSFVINSQTAVRIDKLTQTSESLQTSANDAIESAKDMKNAAQQVFNASASYKDTADSLQKNIQTILDTILHVDQTAEKLLMAQGLNNISNSNALADTMTPDMVKNFVKLSSQRGNVLMYACIKACDQNKPLLLDSIMEDGTFDYCTGFLIAAKSSGLFNLKIWANKNKGIEVIAYHPSLKPALHDLFRDSQIKYYNEMIEKIDSVLQ